MTYRCVSLGGGVQSSVLALMCDQGLFGEQPDAAVHADTGWDPPSTLAMVEWLKDHVSYPVSIVQSRRGALQDAVANPRGPVAFQPVPTFTHRSMGMRQCTREYKIEPIERETRRLLGYLPRQRIPEGAVEQWIGFSTDEVVRVKPSRTRWITQRYPLIEAGMSRRDCLAWWQENAPPDAPALARSSCVGCPYHTRAEWAQIAAEWPDELEQAAVIEESMQAAERAKDRPVSYLHRRLIPLREAVALDVKAQDLADRQRVLFADNDHEICGEGCYL